jgi:hypothetical protein
MPSDWVTRVNAKIAAMDFTNENTAAEDIAQIVSSEIVKELAGVPDEDIREVAKLAIQRMPNIKTRPDDYDDEDDEDDEDDSDMPGLISNDYCELHRMMKVAEIEEDYQEICNRIDDLYEAADRQDRELIVEQDDKGLTLLHWALVFHCPSTVVQTLINAYPDILTYTGDDDCLPLHYAARYRCSLDVVKDVYWIYPDAVLELNEAGIPPHLIARCGGASKDVVDFLEERLQATKAVAKAAAKAAAKNTDLIIQQLEEEEESAIAQAKNACVVDALLATLCALGALLVGVMFVGAS